MREGNRMGARWLVAFLLIGCGGDTASVRDTVDDLDTAEDAQEVDSVGDIAPDTSEPEEVREPSPFLGPCRSNTDCLSGWCVPTAEGTLCTHECGQGCPSGWSCGRVVNTPTDQVDLCLDRTTTLCHPCESDSDCNLFAVAEPARCIDAGGPSGGFCGLACDTGDACPSGYDCVNQSGEITDGAGQCVPSSGECTCNTLAVGLRLATSCYVENEIGTCDGARQCTPGGLTACSARAASEEVCNGIDDDCDGRTDEDLLDAGTIGAACDITNQYGTCPGQFLCVEGGEQCHGVAPVAEICDGLDQNCDGRIDEGFPDQDGDGIADCVDPDLDGDGTPNGLDCAPLDPQRHPGALEVCNGLDDDCDGVADNENAKGCEVWYQDMDGDGFGSQTAPGRCFCGAQPALNYTVKNTNDCNDLNGQIHPDGVEICNGQDDNCSGQTDEGVQAPCGGCVPLCLLPAGSSQQVPFTPDATSASQVIRDGSGNLRLVAGQTSGWYRHRWTGWPLSGTAWTTLFADIETPTGTSVRFRWRSAETEAGLEAAAFSAVAGPFPPASLPIFFEQVGRFCEVEVQLNATSGAVTPLVKKLEIMANSN